MRRTEISQLGSQNTQAPPGRAIGLLFLKRYLAMGNRLILWRPTSIVFFCIAGPEDRHPQSGGGFEPTLSEFALALSDRPAWVVIGSNLHRHLLELANWIGEKERPESTFVFRYLLSSPDERKVFSPQALVSAAIRCTHGLFAFLMTKELLDSENADVLLALLKLPLAVAPDPAGPAHLTPQFSFLGTQFIDWYDATYDRPSEIQHLLIPAWKLFFQRYRDLRTRENHSRTFPDAGMLFQMALASVWGEECCYEDEGRKQCSCIEQSFALFEPDLFCVLHYFNERYFPYLIIWIQDSAEDEREGEVYEFVLDYAKDFTSIMMPLAVQLEKDGWYELACGMIAFYLSISGVMTRGNLDALDGIPRVIKLLRGLPGFNLIERAINLVCELAHQSGKMVTFSRLDQFRQTPDEKITALIAAGEGELCEFKSSLRVNLKTAEKDGRVEQSALKTIAGFLNKRGGDLLIGIGDDGCITGVEVDGFETNDKWNLHFKNLVDRTMPGAMDYVECRLATIAGKTVAHVTCRKSKCEVYLYNRETRQEEFYVRRGSATDNLSMKDAVDYIRRTFQRAETSTE